MDPDEVFNRFNGIIGPDFSLITGRRLSRVRIDDSSRGDAGSTEDREKDLSGHISKTAAQAVLEEPGEDNDERILEDSILLFRGEVARNIHRRLFEPKELVYIRCNVRSQTNVFEEGCVLVTDVTEKTASGDGECIHDLHYVQAWHNGRHFGHTKHSIEIGSSSQEIVNLAAEDLEVVPMMLLPPAKRQDIQARLISRGKKYRTICDRPHILMQCAGLVIPLDRRTDWTWTTNQRVMVDGMAGWEMRGARVSGSFAASRPGQGLEAFLSTERHWMPDGGNPSSIQGGDLVGDDATPDVKGKQKSSEYTKMREDHEWTEIDYLTCPPTLVAFLLDEKVWVNIQVKHLNDVVWPENPFDSLELEAGRKTLIQDLTRRFKTKESNQSSKQLKEEGQGGNLIVLLSGLPGVGKTLTAEVIAEETHRPLYRVSAGELSFDPSALGEQLGDIFLLSQRWGAIILIDEADMFMTKRRASKPEQNEAMTAFLRLLHTYDGLIILTGTSEDIDTAFYDRIHATIRYVGLDENQRTNIWRRQLQRAVGSPEEHPPSPRWPEETYRLLGKVETNGRDIRNIVRTAEQLALGLSTELAMKHVVAAMRNFGGSDDNVGSICEKLEALEEKVGGDREQACDDDVKVSPTLNQ